MSNFFQNGIVNPDLLAGAIAALQKSAFVAAGDPAMTGGDPAAAAAPPPDPSMMGGGGGGMPPMDPAMMAGGGGAPPMDPTSAAPDPAAGTPLTADQVRQIVREEGGGGGEGSKKKPAIADPSQLTLAIVSRIADQLKISISDLLQQEIMSDSKSASEKAGTAVARILAELDKRAAARNDMETANVYGPGVTQVVAKSAEPIQPSLDMAKMATAAIAALRNPRA